MKKNNLLKFFKSKYIPKNFFVSFVAISYVLITFVIPILHTHERKECHESPLSLVKHIHSKNLKETTATLGVVSYIHDPEHCAICHFNTFLAGIKYFPNLRTEQIINVVSLKFHFKGTNLPNFSYQLASNPRAPPIIFIA